MIGSGMEGFPSLKIGRTMVNDVVCCECKVESFSWTNLLAKRRYRTVCS